MKKGTWMTPSPLQCKYTELSAKDQYHYIYSTLCYCDSSVFPENNCSLAELVSNSEWCVMNSDDISSHYFFFYILYLKTENVTTTKTPQVSEPTAKCSYWLLNSNNFSLIKNNMIPCQEVKCTTKTQKTKKKDNCSTGCTIWFIYDRYEKNHSVHETSSF